MARVLRARAHCIDGVLDVDWDISPIEDAFFVRDAVVSEVSHEVQLRRLATHCLTKVDPEFPSRVKPGDFLVGRKGVGWGHGHDHAAMALKAVGVGAVLCETTTVDFKRNCINHGLPLIEIPGLFPRVASGDELEVDLDAGVVRNLANGTVLRFTVYPEFILEILDAGGIYEKMKNEMEGKGTFYQSKEVL